MSSMIKGWPLPAKPVVVNPPVNPDQANTQNDGSGLPQSDQTARQRSRAPLSRDQILDATQICLQELGYDGTTIRKIASKLGCAVGSIYRYFKDKRDLLAVVTQRRFEPVLEMIESGVDFEHSAGRYLAIASEEPEQYRLMFWLASLRDKRAERALPGVIEELLARWVKQMSLDPTQLDEVWCGMHGGLMIGIDPDVLLRRATARLSGQPSGQTEHVSAPSMG